MNAPSPHITAMSALHTPPAASSGKTPRARVILQEAVAACRRAGNPDRVTALRCLRNLSAYPVCPAA